MIDCCMNCVATSKIGVINWISISSVADNFSRILTQKPLIFVCYSILLRIFDLKRVFSTFQKWLVQICYRLIAFNNLFMCILYIYSIYLYQKMRDKSNCVCFKIKKNWRKSVVVDVNRRN